MVVWSKCKIMQEIGQNSENPNRREAILSSNCSIGYIPPRLKVLYNNVFFKVFHPTKKIPNGPNNYLQI